MSFIGGLTLAKYNYVAMESPEKVEAPLELCGGRRKEAREIAWMGHKEEALG